MKEIRKDIEGYEGCYQVSNLGNVMSLDRCYERKCKGITIRQNVNGRILKKNKSTHGYHVVGLSLCGISKKYFVHRLVLLSFYGADKNNPLVNHKDGNKKNNVISNLEWCTNSYNLRHAYRVLGVKHNMTGKFGDKHNRSKAVNQISKHGKFIKKRGSILLASREFGDTHGSNIVACCKGRRCNAYGYKREYADK